MKLFTTKVFMISLLGILFSFNPLFAGVMVSGDSGSSGVTIHGPDQESDSSNSGVTVVKSSSPPEESSSPSASVSESSQKSSDKEKSSSVSGSSFGNFGSHTVSSSMSIGSDFKMGTFTGSDSDS